MCRQRPYRRLHHQAIARRVQRLPELCAHSLGITQDDKLRNEYLWQRVHGDEAGCRVRLRPAVQVENDGHTGQGASVRLRQQPICAVQHDHARL
ncbi:hypothetical protein ACHAWF_003907 [Thalassiosira exigua]